MQGTADFHHQVANLCFPHPNGLSEHAAAFDAAVDVCDAHSPPSDLPIRRVLRPRAGWGTRYRHDKKGGGLGGAACPSSEGAAATGPGGSVTPSCARRASRWRQGASPGSAQIKAEVVDVDAHAVGQLSPRDQAITPKQQDGGDGDGEWRRDSRYEGDGMDKALERCVAVHVTVGEDEAQCSPQERAQAAHAHGVVEDQAILAAIGGVDVSLELLEAELPCGGKEPLGDDAQKLPSDKHEANGTNHEPARQEHWVLRQPLKLTGAARKRSEQGAALLPPICPQRRYRW
jgi:hypothetical protein